MSEHENEFLKELKKSIANYLIGFAFLMITCGVTFYFYASYKLQTHDEKIEKIERQKADKSVMESELANIKISLNRIENKVDIINAN